MTTIEGESLTPAISQPYSTHAAAAFAERWEGVTSEKQFDQKFWRDFFATVCGVPEPDVYVSWQYPAKRGSTGRHGWIDGLWPKVALIEHKSAGAAMSGPGGRTKRALTVLPATTLPTPS